jgi:AraC-like DNA-binding protein
MPRETHSAYTASTRAVWPIVETFRREQWDVERVLSPSGLSQRDLEDPDRRIPQDVVTDLWDRAQTVSGDVNFGLRALQSLSARKRSLVEYLLFNSPTLGAMIERGIRYERLWQEGRGAALERRGTLAVLRWTARPGLRFSPPLSEFAVGMVVFMARAATGRDLQSARGEVRFPHAAPPNPEQYEKLFLAPVTFSASEQALLFAEELLAVPLPRADSALLAVLEEHAAQVLARLPTARSFAQSVRQILATSMAQGDTSLEAIARKLRMSGRTLRRRLLGEIAFLLGFADGAAFNKAFRRWTGQSPSAAHFQNEAQSGMNMWRSHGHFALSCDHGGGHSVPPAAGIAGMQFMLDHPYGTLRSPYCDTAPPELSICALTTPAPDGVSFDESTPPADVQACVDRTKGLGLRSSLFTDKLFACSCDHCGSALAACLDDAGCLSTLQCAAQNGCMGIGCYQDTLCASVIDAAGGIMGASPQLAVAFGDCLGASACALCEGQ